MLCKKEENDLTISLCIYILLDTILFTQRNILDIISTSNFTVSKLLIIILRCLAIILAVTAKTIKEGILFSAFLVSYRYLTNSYRC